MDSPIINEESLPGSIYVDTLLLTIGLIKEEELQYDKSQVIYCPSYVALMKSNAVMKKAAKGAGALGKAEKDKMMVLMFDGDESVGRKRVGFALVTEMVNEERSAVSSHVEGGNGG
eukprot:15331601-Ditylum_brightwellii.AAC.1